MRLAILTTEFPPLVWGGVGRYSAEIANLAASSGWHVEVLLTSGYPIPDDNRRTLVGDQPPSTLVWDHTGLDLWSEPIASMTAKVTSAVEDPGHLPWDVLYVQDSSCARLAAGLMSGGAARRLVFAAHLPTTSRFSYFDRPVSVTNQMRMESLLLRLADVTVAPSQYARDLLLRVHRLDPDRCVAIPLGARAPRSRGPRRQRGDRLRIMWVGRVMRQKGVHTLCRVLPYLRAGELQVVGTGGLAPHLDRALAAAGQPPRIPMLSYHDISVRFRQTDVVLSTAVHETFGLSILEGMAHGAVPVATDSGPVREYVNSGETGVVVRQDAAAIAETIDWLRRDDRALSRLREVALTVSSSMTWERHWAMLSRAFQA